MSSWIRLNRICLKDMYKIIPEAFRGIISKITTAKEFLTDIEQKFVRNDKAELDILLKKFCSK
jgi:hypothetical protein